jgi:hypothetical protein
MLAGCENGSTGDGGGGGGGGDSLAETTWKSADGKIYTFTTTNYTLFKAPPNSTVVDNAGTYTKSGDTVTFNITQSEIGGGITYTSVITGTTMTVTKPFNMGTEVFTKQP